VEEPDYAYNSKRNQYYSTAILNRLKEIPSPAVDKKLGVTEVDLFVPSLNFVFGEAELGGRCALISLCRLRQEFYGLSADIDLLKERMVKEAVHELGHTFNLTHCPSAKCVMHFSNSLQDTDIKSANFCANCRDRLK